jgi:hypothetical protein
MKSFALLNIALLSVSYFQPSLAIPRPQGNRQIQEGIGADGRGELDTPKTFADVNYNCLKDSEGSYNKQLWSDLQVNAWLVNWFEKESLKGTQPFGTGEK